MSSTEDRSDSVTSPTAAPSPGAPNACASLPPDLAQRILPAAFTATAIIAVGLLPTTTVGEPG